MTKLQELMRQIIKNGPISKKELQENTGISWGMVSNLINQLVDERFVVSSLRQSSEVGRKAEEFDVNPQEHLCIGIDLSQHGLLGVVTDLRGRVIRQAERTFREPDRETVLAQIYQMVDGFLAEYADRRIWGIGFSVQGIVEIYEGVSALISGIRDWENVCLKALLEERYSLPTYTEHDPNCVMLAERAVGCLKDRPVREATLLCYDPWIGAGISVITRGQLCHGVRGRAGEIGCNPVDITPDGGWHHLEDLLSYPAMAKAYGQRTGRTVTGEEFAELLAGNDGDACQVYRTIGRYFGFSLAVANNYLNPEIIVLNIVSPQTELLHEEISRYIRAVSFDPQVQVLLSQSGERMKAIGAALILSEKALETL